MNACLRILVAIVAIAVLAYGGIRLYRDSTHLLKIAVVTPKMNARHAIAPSLGTRVYRLMHRPVSHARSGRPKLIALTFDDGPYPIFTPLLLGELRELHVRATFFLIGRDAHQWPGLARRIEADGNEVADHTYSHPDLDMESPQTVRGEILKGGDVLWSLVHDPGVRTLFRPPHGRYTLTTIEVAQALGYHVILWTDDAGDWRTVTPATLERHLELHATAPEIALLHSGKLPTIEMLPVVVAQFRRAGYRFVTVSQLLARIPVADINHPEKHPV